MAIRMNTNNPTFPPVINCWASVMRRLPILFAIVLAAVSLSIKPVSASVGSPKTPEENMAFALALRNNCEASYPNMKERLDTAVAIFFEKNKDHPAVIHRAELIKNSVPVLQEAIAPLGDSKEECERLIDALTSPDSKL